MTTEKKNRKPYSAPLLTKFGSVRSLTAAGSGTNDENPSGDGGPADQMMRP